MEMINMTINGQAVQVPANYTILQAAESVGIRIPTLCYLKDVNAIGACRMCVVEVEKARSNPVACLQQVLEEYNKEHNFAAILATTDAYNVVIVGAPALDITNEIVEGLNAEYIKTRNTNKSE